MEVLEPNSSPLPCEVHASEVEQKGTNSKIVNQELVRCILPGASTSHERNNQSGGMLLEHTTTEAQSSEGVSLSPSRRMKEAEPLSDSERKKKKYRARLPAGLLFVVIMVSVVTAVSLSIWITTYDAGQKSVNELSKSVRQQLMNAATGRIDVIFTKAEHSLRNAVAAVKGLPDIMETANTTWPVQLYDTFERAVCAPAHMILPSIFSIGVHRSELIRDMVYSTQSFILMRNLPSGFIRFIRIRSTINLFFVKNFSEAAENYYSTPDVVLPGSLARVEGEQNGMLIYPILRSDLPNLTDDILWEDRTYFTMTGIPTFTVFSSLKYKDLSGVLYISLSFSTADFSKALAASVVGSQRLFLTLHQPEGYLLGTSHGKYWSQSDVPEANIWGRLQTGELSWYSPQNCTDMIISEVSNILWQRFLTWDVRNVDVSVRALGETWLVMSQSMNDNGRKVELWLLQDETILFGRVQGALRKSVIIFVCLVTAAMVVGIISSVMIVFPLRRLQRSMGLIASMELQGIMEKMSSGSTILEVNRLQSAFYRMLVSIDSFAKYVPLGVVRRIVEQGKQPTLTMQCAELSILFLDVASFTTISSMLTVDSVGDFLTIVLGDFSNVICQHKGTIDKYIGDCVMALWGAPESLEKHQLYASRAAYGCLQITKTTLKDKLLQAHLPKVQIRVGLHSGDVLVGNVGSPERYNYTAIGDHVNVAARLEPACKIYRCQLLVSSEIQQVAQREFIFMPLGLLQVVGRQEPISVFEMVGAQAELLGIYGEDHITSLATKWKVALECYHKRQFKDAKVMFEELQFLSCCTKLFIIRCDQYILSPPGELWNGMEIQSAK